MSSPKSTGKDGQDIFNADFVGCLPGVLKHDPKIRAIAEAVAKEALKVSGEIEKVLIYSRIDKLPEALIDILAYDMHVDWYDYAFPLKVKRDILKGSVKVHKKMGTKYAVEKALRDVYKNARVEEWFEYGGEPYTFRVIIDLAGDELTEETKREVESKMKHYKNLRSHCENFIYRAGAERGIVRSAQYTGMGVEIRVRPKGR